MTENSALPNDMYSDIFRALPWLGVWWRWRRVCRAWRDILDNMDWSTCTVLRLVDEVGHLALCLASDNDNAREIHIYPTQWHIIEAHATIRLCVFGPWQPHFLDTNWTQPEDPDNMGGYIALATRAVYIEPRVNPRQQHDHSYEPVYVDFARFIELAINVALTGKHGQWPLIEEATSNGAWRRLLLFMHYPPIKRALLEHYDTLVKTKI